MDELSIHLNCGSKFRILSMETQIREQCTGEGSVEEFDTEVAIQPLV